MQFLWGEPQGKLNTAFGEDVENRIESFRKQLKTGVNHFGGTGGTSNSSARCWSL